MILSKKLSEAFNAQVNAEMWSSNLYLSMAVYFKKEGLNGFASWMMKQAEEEMEHAHQMIDYALDRGGDITIGAINVVPTGWGNPLEVFEHVYKHECYVSELIDKMVEIADYDQLYEKHYHPYTEALLSAIPQVNQEDQRERIHLEGEVPSPTDPPSGCRFHTRCPKACERCRLEEPALREIAPGHLVACHCQDAKGGDVK